MLDRPQLAGPVKAHLDFIDDEQNTVLIKHLLQLDEEVLRRDHITAGALDRLDIEGRIFALAGLGIPDAVIFALKKPRELLDAMLAIFLLAHALGPPEVIGERDELGALAEMAVAAAVAVGRGDRRGPQRAPVIAALEGEHQAFAVREIGRA